MGPSNQENSGLKDFMGLGRDTARASCAEARKHMYASGHNMPGHIHMDKQPMLYNVDPHVSSQHNYADAIALVKSNILDAVHQRPTACRWLYNNNNGLANVATGHPDWNNPGGRQQFFSFNISQEQRGVEKVNDAYQIMHARGNGNALNCNLPAKRVPDPSGSGLKVFPFVAPVLHEQASTARVYQIPIAKSPALTAPLLAGGGPSARMQPANSSIKSSSTQLTIFYAGKVNVYNDVNSIKAQEIMLMAASSSSLPLNMDMYSGTSIQMVTPPLSGSLKNADPPEVSRINPSTCQPDQLARDQVGIGPLSASIPQAPQADESCLPVTESTYLDDESAFPRALPQARKASLARFLERRKERVLSKSPYPVEKTFL